MRPARTLALFVRASLLAAVLFVASAAGADPGATRPHGWAWLDEPIAKLETWRAQSEANGKRLEADARAKAAVIQAGAEQEISAALDGAWTAMEKLAVSGGIPAKTLADHAPAAGASVEQKLKAIDAARAALSREAAGSSNALVRSHGQRQIQQLERDTNQQIAGIRGIAAGKVYEVERQAKADLATLQQSTPVPANDAKRLAATREFRRVLEKHLPADFVAGSGRVGSQPAISFDKDLFTELLCHGFHALTARTAQRSTVKPEAEALASRIDALVAQHAAPGELVRAVLGGLGPGYVKLGQLLANRPDLVAPAYRADLAKLSDEAVAMPFEAVERTIEASLSGKPRLETVLRSPAQENGWRRSGLVSLAFASIDHAPVGTGSIGQVHLGTLKDGRRVAIKVIKHEVKDRLLSNLDSMDAVVLARDEKGAGRAFRALVQEIRRLGEFETDLRTEAATIREMGPVLARDGVRVPKVEADLSSETVLVEEIARGAKSKAALFGSQLAPLVSERLMGTMLRQVLVYGRFHNDPHEGNIFVDAAGNVELIDWGLSSRISVRERLALGFLVASVDRGRPRWTESIARGLDSAGLGTDAIRASVEAMPKAGSPFERAQALLVDLQMKGAELPPSLVQASKALLLADGVAQKTDPTWTASRATTLLQAQLKTRPLDFIRGVPAPPAREESGSLDARYREALIAEIPALRTKLAGPFEGDHRLARARLQEIMTDPAFETRTDRAARESARVALAKGLVEELAVNHANHDEGHYLAKAYDLAKDPLLATPEPVKAAFDRVFQQRIEASRARIAAKAPYANDTESIKRLEASLRNRNRFAPPVRIGK